MEARQLTYIVINMDFRKIMPESINYQMRVKQQPLLCGNVQ